MECSVSGIRQDVDITCGTGSSRRQNLGSFVCGGSMSVSRPWRVEVVLW